MAFDKVLTSGSRWSNAQGQFPAWIGYAHPAAVDVAFVRVWCDSLLGIGTAQCPPDNAAVSIERSADGILWTSAGTTVWHGGSWVENGVVLLSAAAASIKATHPSRAQVAASAPSAPYAAPRPSRIAFARDLEFGGTGRVRNTVKEKGAPDTPVRRRVRLVRERDGLVVREQWSDPATGAYDFQFVDERQTYTVLSYDHTLDFRAVIADGLTLANGTVELMP